MKCPPRDKLNWIQCFQGGRAYPLNLRPSEVHIEDIAHHLALQNRYAGATITPYSVAQHSVLVSRLCKEAPLWGLLHDAAEAYLHDITRPIKKHLTNYRFFQEMATRVIAKKFRLAYPEPTCVKVVDNRMLVTERRDLMKTPPKRWSGLDGVKPYDFTIKPWGWKKAEREFLKRFKELTS